MSKFKEIFSEIFIFTVIKFNKLKQSGIKKIIHANNQSFIWQQETQLFKKLIKRDKF